VPGADVPVCDFPKNGEPLIPNSEVLLVSSEAPADLTRAWEPQIVIYAMLGAGGKRAKTGSGWHSWNIKTANHSRNPEADLL